MEIGNWQYFNTFTILIKKWKGILTMSWILYCLMYKPLFHLPNKIGEMTKAYAKELLWHINLSMQTILTDCNALQYKLSINDLSQPSQIVLHEFSITDASMKEYTEATSFTIKKACQYANTNSMFT